MLHFGLIGFPLAHSYSKQYFEKLFTGKNLTAQYTNFPIENLLQLKQLITKHQLDGFNITIPFKEEVIDLLDLVDPNARAVNAVNCVKVKNGKLTGFNTDVYGFERSFLSLLPPGSKYKALVFGTGGSSKAVQYCLTEKNIPFLLVSRHASNRTITYEELDQQLVDHHNILINTTPVGMFPDTNDSLPLPFHLVNEKHYAFDLIYNPEETIFLKNCRRQKALVKNGLEMLHLQAEESLRIFLS